MPQFDLFCFSTQVFWICIIFFLFYFLFSQIFLPNISNTLKLREKRKKLFLEKGDKNNLSLFSLFLFYILI